MPKNRNAKLKEKDIYWLEKIMGYKEIKKSFQDIKSLTQQIKELKIYLYDHNLLPDEKKLPIQGSVIKKESKLKDEISNLEKDIAYMTLKIQHLEQAEEQLIDQAYNIPPEKLSSEDCVALVGKIRNIFRKDLSPIKNYFESRLEEIKDEIDKIKKS